MVYHPRTAIARCIAGAALVGPLVAVACPAGMQGYMGTGGVSACMPAVPAFDYRAWRQERLDSWKSSRGAHGLPDNYVSQPMTKEEVGAMQAGIQRQKEEAARRKVEAEKGQWAIESKPTSDGTLCSALFSKFVPGQRGGMVNVLGFQGPHPNAWLMFYSEELPRPRSVTKLDVSLQQDDEPAQTVKTFNYRLSEDVGVVVFAVPGLGAAVDGMREKQSFKLSVDGKQLMNISWANGAEAIQQLKQCAK
jgi:hypothetical protein